MSKPIKEMSRKELESECVHLRTCYFSMKDSLEDAKTEHIINDLPFVREIKERLSKADKDSTQKEFVNNMIDDWISEMEKN